MPDTDLINLLSADAAALLARSVGPLAPSDLAQEGPSHAPSTGAQPVIPGYTLVARLGGGGEGEVYRAYRTGSAAPVALKVLHPRATPAAQQRAWRELAALQALRSPHVPRLVDFGVVNLAGSDRIYFATELVEGQPLDEATADWPLDRRIELLAQACDAVQTIHERPLLHRDLKPDNILLDLASNPPHLMIIDFGLADLLSVEQATLTLEGTPLGTPAYMAPEQARGEVHAWSVRTDVYGLGATAFRVLTGQAPRPPGASIHAALLAAATEAVPAARSVRHDLPEVLSLIVAKAMAPRPEHRYATAADLARDLRAFLTGEPVSVVRPSRWRRAIAWAERHPVWVSAAAGASVLAASVIVTFLAVWWLNALPHRVVLERGEIEARVYSRSGAVVKAWQSTRTMPVASPARGPAGERLAVIGDADRAGSDAWSGRLAVYDFADLDTPRWMTPIAERDLRPPPHLRTPPASVERSRFVLGPALVADIFPERPGDEIVAVLNHTASSVATIRVYSADGHVLDECWHDGRIYGVHWLREARLLAVCASNNEIVWRSLAVIQPPNHPWSQPLLNLGPNVYSVFAFQPRTAPSAPPEPSVIALWPAHRTRAVAYYRLLLPLELSARGARLEFAHAHSSGTGVERARLDIAFPAGGIASLELDERGNITSRSVDDAFRAAPSPLEAYRARFDELGLTRDIAPVQGE